MEIIISKLHYCFRTLYDVLKQIVYPKRCPICSDIIPQLDRLCCRECENKLTIIDGPRCMRCSKPIESEYDELCYDCSHKESAYQKGYALWLYDDIVQQSVIGFKYYGKKEYAAFYAAKLVESYGDVISKLHIEALIPIPIHIRKLNIRGYNQALVLADKISELTGIPVIKDILIRDVYTIPQKELNDVERRKNLMKAFKIRDENFFKDKKINNILLIDDIYTTGSTIEACSKKIKNAGCRNIYFLSICIGIGE